MNFLNLGFIVTGSLCATLHLATPLAYWDMCIPHGDGETLINNAEIERETRERKEVVAELAKEIARKEWRSEQDRWERDTLNESGYQGTCGPPDRDR